MQPMCFYIQFKMIFSCAQLLLMFRVGQLSVGHFVLLPPQVFLKDRVKGKNRQGPREVDIILVIFHKACAYFIVPRKPALPPHLKHPALSNQLFSCLKNKYIRTGCVFEYGYFLLQGILATAFVQHNVDIFSDQTIQLLMCRTSNVFDRKPCPSTTLLSGTTYQDSYV